MLGKDWSSIIQTAQRRHWRVIWASILQPVFRLVNHDGVSVVEEDWDHLIILDACRYDVFKEVNWLNGRLEKRVSKGSTTIEFLNKNFTEYYDDIVYVTANAHASPFPADTHRTEPFNGDEHFHDVVDVFLDGEAQERGATRPEAVTDAAQKADEEYPHKRKIIHYVQPHTPFIGDVHLMDEPVTHHEDLLQQGFTWDDIREAYRSNLRRALQSVEELLENIEGKIVITADHGEALGEYGLSMHPYGIYIKELVEVPWFITEQGERPEIRGEDVNDLVV